MPAEVAHHFLLAICTRPGSGICFKDNGWYPREDGEGQSAAIPISTNSEGSKVHNKILAGVVKSLRLSDDPRQRELALRILKACPELVAGYVLCESSGISQIPNAFIVSGPLRR